MDKRRVVVTGMGTVNPLGKRVDEFWKNIGDIDRRNVKWNDERSFTADRATIKKRT